MAAPGFLEGLIGIGKSAAADKPKKSSKAAKSFGDPFAAAGKGREGLLAGNSDEGKAPLLSVLGSHRFETTPGSAKIRRVKKRA